MTGLRTLVLDGQQITDLSPLEGLPLESLSLCDNPISDLTVAASLTNLKFLAIEETDVTDLSPLGELDALTELDIGTIPAADLDSIAGTNIEYLVMNAVPAEHYEALYTLPLKKLVMHSYSADDIDTVSQILTLEQLTIYGYPYNTLEVLLGLTNLKSLDITGGGVRTLEGIEELTALQTLTIGDTQVTDLTPLLQNTKLSYLYITDIPAGDYSVLAQMSRLLQVTCSEAQKEEIEQEIDDLQFQINIQ